MNRLQSAKRVSFDIFDTLLHRLVLAPVDVFEMVRLRAFEDPRSLLCHDLLQDFLNARMRAESDARATRVRTHGGEGEITIDEIYQQWIANTGATPDLADWLKQLELDCERCVLVPSEDGLAFYEEARAAGCDIVFASDMYLPTPFLRERLAALGFSEAEKYPLYVSGEVRVSKHLGTLYPHIAQAEGWAQDATWLHVGDNKHADVEMATKAGLAAHLATWGKVHNVPTIRNSSGSGNFIYAVKEALELPQAQRRLPDDPLERIAYQIWGPMLFGFTCWLLEQFRSEGIRHAVFVARDGWLMQRLVQMGLSSLSQTDLTTSYFYMSRKIGFKTGVRDWDPQRAWFYVAGKNRISVNRAFAAAGLKAEDYGSKLKAIGLTDFDAPLNDSDKRRLVNFMNTICMDILLRSMEMRRTFAAHYDSVLPESGTLAFVDIGWVGNIQRCFLHSLSDTAASARVHGYYLGLHRDFLRPNAELGMKMRGWMNGSTRYDELNQALLNGGVELLEFLLTAPHGSTIDLEKTECGVAPVLEEQSELEKQHQAKAQRAQKGVIRFFEDYRFLFDTFTPGTLSNPVWSDNFIRLVMQPSDDELEALANITHSDAAGSNDTRLVLARKLSHEEARSPSARAKAREEAFWKAAFDRLNPA